LAGDDRAPEHATSLGSPLAWQLADSHRFRGR
jgi:hypothetical protein